MSRGRRVGWSRRVSQTISNRLIYICLFTLVVGGMFLQQTPNLEKRTTDDDSVRHMMSAEWLDLFCESQHCLPHTYKIMASVRRVHLKFLFTTYLLRHTTHNTRLLRIILI